MAGCQRAYSARGYCPMHYQRLVRGLPIGGPEMLRRSNGEGTINPRGYVWMRWAGKYRYQHRVVMEQHIGRALRKDERVHHINGVRHDNRLENLELWSSSHPAGQRVVDKLAWAKQFIALYEGEAAA